MAPPAIPPCQAASAERLDSPHRTARSSRIDEPGPEFAAKMPSQVFREHVLTCFIDDVAGLEMPHGIGTESICWECDYPHSDSTWSSSPEQLARSLAGISGTAVNQILDVAHVLVTARTGVPTSGPILGRW
jgi:hypothetical protein